MFDPDSAVDLLCRDFVVHHSGGHVLTRELVDALDHCAANPYDADGIYTLEHWMPSSGSVPTIGRLSQAWRAGVLTSGLMPYLDDAVDALSLADLGERKHAWARFFWTAGYEFGAPMIAWNCVGTCNEWRWVLACGCRFAKVLDEG